MANRSVASSRKRIGNFLKSLYFDYDNDMGQIEYAPDFDNGFSIGFWINRLYTGASTTLICATASDGTSNGFRVGWDANSKGFYASFNDGSTTAWATSGNPTPPFGEWYHVVAQYSPTASGIKLYINGRLRNSATKAKGTASATHIQVGARAATPIEEFKGYIAGLTLQNAIWDSDTILNLYYQDIKPTNSVWYNLNDNVSDISGQGYDMTLTGTSYSTTVPNPTRTSVTNRRQLSPSWF